MRKGKGKEMRKEKKGKKGAFGCYTCQRGSQGYKTHQAKGWNLLLSTCIVYTMQVQMYIYICKNNVRFIILEYVDVNNKNIITIIVVSVYSEIRQKVV